MSDRAGHDAIVVGASLAGCTTATLLSRAGLRVALIEKRPDPTAFKRICSHFIQASAVPTLGRLGLLDELDRLGALRSHARLWTRWGWITPSARYPQATGLNIRRERLDPLVRSLAAETDGVELILGESVVELIYGEAGDVAGVVTRGRDGARRQLRAPLTIGADGRDSTVGELAPVKTKRSPHGRFAYAAYYEGPEPDGAPDASLWLLDPQMVAAFPTDSGLTMYACMPTADRLPEFRRDLDHAFESLVSEVPDAPPIRECKRVDRLQGKIDMTNVTRAPTAPGLALAGDAALALDPLWGIGCGFALQTGEWLADAVAPALAGERSLAEGLAAYRRRYAKGLHAHASVVIGYASGRKLDVGERIVFSAAARDERVAALALEFGARSTSPASFLSRAVPRALLVHARTRLSSAAANQRRPYELAEVSR